MAPGLIELRMEIVSRREAKMKQKRSKKKTKKNPIPNLVNFCKLAEEKKREKSGRGRRRSALLIPRSRDRLWCLSTGQFGIGRPWGGECPPRQRKKSP
jgi:hypothetical protein